MFSGTYLFMFCGTSVNVFRDICLCIEGYLYMFCGTYLFMFFGTSVDVFWDICNMFCGTSVYVL